LGGKVKTSFRYDSSSGLKIKMETKTISAYFDYLCSNPLCSKDGDAKIRGYLKKLEESVSSSFVIDTFAKIKVGPDFFCNNYKESLELFPIVAKRMRNGGGKDVVISCRDYDLKLNGHSSFLGGVIEKKGRMIYVASGNPEDFCGDTKGTFAGAGKDTSRESGEKYVKYAGTKGMRSFILNDFPKFKSDFISLFPSFFQALRARRRAEKV
jgi:hypothetical protein